VVVSKDIIFGGIKFELKGRGIVNGIRFELKGRGIVNVDFECLYSSFENLGCECLERYIF
jgi:hypothetical protein